jgi:hypothetical protein
MLLRQLVRKVVRQFGTLVLYLLLLKPLMLHLLLLKPLVLHMLLLKPLVLHLLLLKPLMVHLLLLKPLMLHLHLLKPLVLHLHLLKPLMVHLPLHLRLAFLDRLAASPSAHSAWWVQWQSSSLDRLAASFPAYHYRQYRCLHHLRRMVHHHPSHLPSACRPTLTLMLTMAQTFSVEIP